MLAAATTRNKSVPVGFKWWGGHQEAAVKRLNDSALVEVRTGALSLPLILAPLTFLIAGLSALSLFAIAGLAALCCLIAALVGPYAAAAGSILRARKTG